MVGIVAGMAPCAIRENSLSAHVVRPESSGRVAPMAPPPSSAEHPVKAGRHVRGRSDLFGARCVRALRASGSTREGGEGRHDPCRSIRPRSRRETRSSTSARRATVSVPQASRDARHRAGPRIAASFNFLPVIAPRTLSPNQERDEVLLRLRLRQPVPSQRVGSCATRAAGSRKGAMPASARGLRGLVSDRRWTSSEHPGAKRWASADSGRAWFSSPRSDVISRSGARREGRVRAAR